jgi:hypothetical protein
MRVNARRTIAAMVLLLPFVIFQGAPEWMPAWLARPLLGVPGTVWLVAVLGYGGFVALIWRCMRDEVDETAS